MQTLAQAFLNLLFPPICLACHTPLVFQEQHLCLSCVATLPPAELDQPLLQEALLKKFYGLIPFKHTFALYYFSKQGRVQKLLHNLKYHNQTKALLFLGNQLAQKLKTQQPHTPFDLIIPVPLHSQRYQERGYNQSELLAQGLSQTLQIPTQNNILIRQKNTFTQTANTRQQRWDNVADAFLISPQLHTHLQDKHILLVDDLVTTGATLTASAQHLLDASVHAISLATLAVAS